MRLTKAVCTGSVILQAVRLVGVINTAFFYTQVYFCVDCYLCSVYVYMV